MSITTSTATVPVGVGPVSFDDVLAVARDGAGVTLADDARSAIERARAVVEELAGAPTPAYGICCASRRWRPAAPASGWRRRS
jgi:histidine ammonia-lyase